jgi:hypothetical protein
MPQNLAAARIYGGFKRLSVLAASIRGHDNVASPNAASSPPSTKACSATSCPGCSMGAHRRQSIRPDGRGWGVEIFGHLDGGNFLDAGRATVFAGD